MKHKPKLKSGLAPGTPFFTGRQKMDQVEISVIKYNEEEFSEFNCPDVKTLLSHLIKNDDVVWVNIIGLHDEDTIETICSHLKIHKLTTEDILNVGQRPKLEEHNDYLHIVVKMLMNGQTEDIMDIEQLSFILVDNILLTFQEKTGDVFDPIRKRIRESKGFIRKKKSDYLQYILLDAVVDYYFIILEQFGENLEEIENSLIHTPQKTDLNKVHIIRREALELRRAIYPMRELVNSLGNLDNKIMSPETKVYIRDLYDHTIQTIETVEVFRETAVGLIDLYMNTASNKMNEIMKVLTIVSSVFIPLTFVAGVYGMNFHNMPELRLQYGYYLILGLMAMILIGMIIFFKRKKWL